MVTRKQSIANFSTKMDELINSSYILSDKKITNVLKAITSSKLFFELVTFCSEDYCYEYDRDNFAKNKQPFVFDDDKQLIAFGVNLLANIDSKEEDLLNILTVNYNNDNFDKSYKEFAKNFLTPLKEVMLKTVNLMMDAKEHGLKNISTAPVVQESEQVTFSDVQMKFDESQGEIRRNYKTCYSDIQQIILRERNAIMYARIKEDDKSDLLNLLEAFRDCLFMGENEQLRMSFISYKYAVTNFKKVNSEYDDIERILKFCKIM